MKTKTLIIILMLLSASEVLAQSRIWEMSTTPADTTIVREWREGKYIVYSRQGSNLRQGMARRQVYRLLPARLEPNSVVPRQSISHD